MELTHDVAASCPECSKTFRTAAELRKHLPKHGAATLRCPRKGCLQRFKWPQALREHVVTQHEGRYRHRCRLCERGFQSLQKLEMHHCDPEQPRNISAAVGSQLHEQLLHLVSETLRLTAEHASGRDTTRRPRRQARRAASDGKYFTCASCKEEKPSIFGDLVKTPSAMLPSLNCVECLVKAGRPPTACIMAAMGRYLVMAYIEELGYSVDWMQPDGWCLLECVTRATPFLEDRTVVLRLALETIRGGLPLAHLDPTTREEAKGEAARLLNQLSVAARNIGRWCNSDLWDFMPQALSRVCGRPLLIYSGDVSGRQVNVTLVNETGQVGQVSIEPIRLIRSCFEYNCAHYDLVIRRTDQGADDQAG